MKRAMMVTVGTGTRPDVNIVNPLVKTIRDSNPSYLVLIATKDSERFAEEIAKQMSLEPENYEIHVLKSEDDFEHIFKELNSIVNGLLKRGFSSEEIYADYTSGTKAMTSGLVLSAIYNSFGSLKYITGTRKNGIVEGGTERFLSITPNAILASHEIITAQEFMKALRFESAQRLLSEVNPYLLSVNEKDLLADLKNLASGYLSWDSFQHERFKGEYSKVKWSSPKLEVFRVKNEIPDRLIKIAKTLKNSEINEDILADLFNNFARRFREGKYDDALARLYRLTEMFAQWRLKAKHDIKADDVDIKKVPQELKTELEYLRDKKTGKIRLGLRRAFMLLRALKDNVSKKYEENSKLRNLLNQRNYTILAHGTNPITPEVCKSLRDEVLGMIKSEIPEFEKRCLELQFPWLKGAE